MNQSLFLGKVSTVFMTFGFFAMRITAKVIILNIVGTARNVFLAQLYHFFEERKIVRIRIVYSEGATANPIKLFSKNCFFPSTAAGTAITAKINMFPSNFSNFTI